MKQFKFNVQPGQVRRMADPINSDRDLFYVHVSLAELPPDLPLDVNPRSQKLGSPVAKKIRRSLEKAPDRFHLLNRGITIIAENAYFDNKTNEFTLVFPEGSSPILSDLIESADNGAAFDLDKDVGLGSLGIVDGGHTYAVIRDFAEHAPEEDQAKLKQGFVRFEVITGISSEQELITDLARARNTSTQVKEQTLDEFLGKFKWIKTALDTAGFPRVVKYEENAPEPVDVRFVIQLMTAFHPLHLERERSPVIAYSQAATCASNFRREADSGAPLGYPTLRPIIPDILNVYGYVRANFATWYRTVGGYSTVKSERPDQDPNLPAKTSGRIGDESKGFSSPSKIDRALFPDLMEDVDYVPDLGFVFPFISSLRALLTIDGATGEAKFSQDPIQYLQANSLKLTRVLLREAIGENYDPQKVGKKRNFWDYIHEKVLYDVALSNR